MNRKLTKKEAIDLFRKLWTDMQTELGDCPDFVDRRLFKSEWCKKNFPDEIVLSNCPLCEYAYGKYQENEYKGSSCRFCPIKWPIPDVNVAPCCQGSEMHYLLSPISKILALPEREVPDDTNETV